MKLIFATHNGGKVKEMRELLAGLEIDVQTADEAGVTEDVVEDGKTFEENALKKATFVMEKTGEWSVADDSGLCIDALDGAPGVLTARWAGEGASAETLVAHTLKKLKDVPAGQRTATFVSCLALIAPDGRTWMFDGSVGGRVGLEPRGESTPKLPYDVLFIPDGWNQTFAEMPAGEKNKISHRGLAFQKLKAFLGTLPN